jgi:hypothetical protein
MKASSITRTVVSGNASPNLDLASPELACLELARLESAGLELANLELASLDLTVHIIIT